LSFSPSVIAVAASGVKMELDHMIPKAEEDPIRSSFSPVASEEAAS